MALNLQVRLTETTGHAHLFTTAMDETVFKAIISNLEVVTDRILKNPCWNLRQVLAVGPESQIQLQPRPPGVHAECIHWLVRKQAASRPNSQAVIAPDCEYTYAQLDRLSDALAEHFISLGVVRHSMVALCLQKSALAIVAMLAILKAGGVCVPLDPGHPIERHRTILEKTNARLIVTDAASRQSVIDLPVHQDLISHAFLASLTMNFRSDESIFPQSRPSDAAWVIFTSGSTGTPKGIVLEHVSICSSTIETGPVLGIDETSRVFQFAAYTFDVSIEEIVFTLILGGCICVPSEADRLSNLGHCINELQATWIDMTASVARLIDPSEVPSLRTLNSGGELLGQDLIKKWSDHVTLKNTFGPAEGSVNSTCNPSVRIGTSSQDVGRPVGCFVWIVDSEDPNKILPIGAVGEILLQGPTVAREYIGDSEKTSAHFMDSVSWSSPRSGPNWRFYRTGDLGRYREDGTLLFLGRKDSQVKLHGLRIELDEIENCLLSHGNVRHAMSLIAHEGPAKDKLIAIINLESDHPLMQNQAQDDMLDGDSRGIKKIDFEEAQAEIANIRGHLEQKFPRSHVPSIYCLARSLPMTMSVKIDRPSVRRWVQSWDNKTYIQICGAALSNSTVIPTTETEKCLQAAAAHVLNRPPESVPLDGPFISLGGDSITAMQMVSRSRRLGVHVTVHDLLRATSIIQLAREAELRPTTAPKTFASIDSSEDFALSPIQRTHFELEPLGKDRFSLGFNVMTRHYVTHLDLESAMANLVQRHPMLRARYFQDSSGQWRQKISTGKENDFSVEWRDSNNCQDVPGFLSSGPDRLDIRKGPLVAATVFDAQDGQLTIAFTAHHLVVDLVSWRILLDDLETLLKGEPLSIDHTLSFQTWCALQQEHVNSYLSPEHSLPFSVPAAPYAYWGMSDQPNEYSDVLVEEFVLDESVVAKLLGPSNNALKSEPVEILLAVLHYSFISVFSDRGPPQVFSEGHGRQPWDDALDLSRTVGWFTILSPLCVSLPRPSTALEYLEEVMRIRRSTPANGWEYFATRYLHKDATETPAYLDHLPMEILFNFMGSFQQLDRPEALFRVASPDIAEAFTEIQIGQRDNLFETALLINGGRATCRLEYSRRMLHQDRIQLWWRRFSELLISFSEELCSTAPSHTASEYPLLPLQPNQFHSLERTIADVTEDFQCNEIEDVYPCTTMQVGILLSQIQDPQLYAVHTIWELRLPSLLPEPELVVLAWNCVIQHHPILRTVFVENSALDAPFYQVVYKSINGEIATLNVDNALDDPETVLKSLSAPQYRQGRPCHQLTLAACTNGAVFCRLDLSHAIVDGYSMDIIIRDLRMAYMQRLKPTKKPRYSDFVAYLMKQNPELDLAYWKKYLNTLEPCLVSTFLETPVDHKKRLAIAFNLDNSDISHFCREHNITTFNIVQAAWALVLKIYTMSDDVCFGYLVSDRDLPIEGLDDVVGPFISMLIQRVTVSKSATLLDLTRSIQTDVYRSLQHRHSSLADIHHELDHTSRSLFNTILSFQKETIDDDLSDDPRSLTFREVEAVDPAEYDISVGIKETTSRLEIVLSYWTSCMDISQADSIADTFREAIDLIVNKSTMQSGRVALVGLHDREHLAIWNGDEKPSVKLCINDLIKVQAEKAPHALAIEAWDNKFTYSRMDELSSRLAGYLSDANLRRGDCVALCFSKSAWATIASLAVLKAGGICVQFDPEWQEDRKQSILTRIKARTVLVSSEHSSLFAENPSETFVVDENTASSWPKDISTSGAKAMPEDAAFILFTSGSTGEPKGAVITHSAMASSSLAHGKAQGVHSGSRVYQFAAHTFDVAVADIFTTLIHGGCICVPSEFDRLNNLTQSIKTLRANWIHLTPTVSQLIHPDDIPELQTLVVGGESLSKNVVDRWANRCNLINTYGPAECSVTSACHTSIQPQSRTSLIGRPVGTRIWIVDPTDHNILLPIGAVGEILIEGPNLAQGYLGDKSKTDSAFVQDVTWATTSSRRFYKTGDLGCWTSQGSLVFSRRKDTIGKLRGIKIDLSDIESTIKKLLPTTCMVAVELSQITKTGRENAVIAFVRTAESTNLHLSKLRSQISDSLSPHMIPKVIIPLEQMPMTPSGKIDRKVLRKISSEMTEDQLAKYVNQSKKSSRPLTEPEVKMAKLWEKVLNLPAKSITCDDSFLEVGGDSLSAMKLVALAQNVGIHLTVAAIFHQRSLSGLCSSALSAESAQSTVQPRSLEPFTLIGSSFSEKVTLRAEVAAALNVSPGDVDDAYPVTALQESVMASTTKQPGAFTLQEALEIPDTIDLARFRAAWTQVIEHIPILRTRIVTTADHGMIQAVIRDGTQWREIDSELDQFLGADMEMAMGPGTELSRVAIVRDMQAQKTYMVWTMSHALYDGLSRSSMWSALEKAYKGQALQHVPSFANYVAYLANTPKADAENFWQRKMSDASPLAYPKEPSRNNAVTRTSSVAITIPYERRGSSFLASTVLQGAWAMLLAEYTGCPDVTFGVTMSGRSAAIPGVEQIIGPVIALVPNRTIVSQQTSINDYLREVQDEMVQALQHQHIGLQDIRRLSSSAESACRFQNIMNIYSASDVRTGNDAVFENLPRVPNSLSKFDTFPLILDCGINAKAITIDARFSTESVSVVQARRLLHQLHDRIQHLTTIPSNAKLADVPLASTLDESQIFQGMTTPLCVSRPIHCVVKESLLDKPDDHAIVAWDGSLSNLQLELLSDRLARHLAQFGVRPGDFVPVVFEKSMWTIVAQLAILKLGCAFVPLDPLHPPARLREIIRELNATVAVCAIKHEELCLGLELRTVAVGPAADWMQDENDVTDWLPVEIDPDEPAYVLFTSGSTGKPKGVVVSHKAFCSSLASHGQVLGLNKSTRMLQFCAYTFDVSLGEIWGTLTHGGCVCVPSEEARSSLVHTINTFAVNTALLTPTLAREFSPEDVPTLRTMTVGGEQMREDTIQVWSQKLNLVNGYGPTEATILSVMEPSAREPFIIGRPVGCNGWIVNPENHNVLSAVGTIGEFLIEGPILANGYLNDVAKTQRSFIQDPKWSLKQGLPGPRRFYKTGDLVQYTEDGSFKYVGRKESDGQVKIRGLRIELGEIEHHLNAHALVQHAVVVGSSRGLCKDKLVGVIALQSCKEDPTSDTLQIVTEMSMDSTKSNSDQLHKSLSRCLPYYMVPTMWIFVKHMPQLSSGKTDRRFVTKWIEDMGMSEYTRSIDSSSTTETLTLPETSLESDLLALWAEALERSTNSIGTNRAFTALGGDSIRAMRLVAKCGQKGINVRMVDVLRAASIQDMARSIEQQEAVSCKSLSGTGASLGQSVPQVAERKNGLKHIMQQAAREHGIDPSNTEDVGECSILQHDMLLSQKRLPGSNRVQTIWRITTEDGKTLNLTRLIDAWQGVTKRHAALRTIFLQSTINGQPTFFSVVLKSYTPVINLRSTPPHGNADFADGMTVSPFKLGQYQHLTTIWATKESNVIVFQLEINHTIFDGVSWSTVMQDLQSLYYGDQLQPSNSLKWSAPSSSEGSSEIEGNWDSYLSDLDACNIPESSNDTLPDVKCQWGSQTLTFKTSHLSDFCRGTAITLPNLIQAAWALTLHKITAQKDICFGYLVSNRMKPDGTHDTETAGCGIDMLVQRTRLGQATHIEEILHGVRDDCAEHIFQPRTSPLLSYHATDRRGKPRFNSMVNVRMFAQQARENAEAKKERWRLERIGGEDPWDVSFPSFLAYLPFPLGGALS